jgi:hypothetical protein
MAQKPGPTQSSVKKNIPLQSVPTFVDNLFVDYLLMKIPPKIFKYVALMSKLN